MGSTYLERIALTLLVTCLGAGVAFGDSFEIDITKTEAGDFRRICIKVSNDDANEPADLHAECIDSLHVTYKHNGSTEDFEKWRDNVTGPEGWGSGKATEVKDPDNRSKRQIRVDWHRGENGDAICPGDTTINRPAGADDGGHFCFVVKNPDIDVEVLEIRTDYEDDRGEDQTLATDSDDRTVDEVTDDDFEDDADGDGIPDGFDATPTSADQDEDGFIDGADKCPSVPNPDQIDVDADQLGDACDPCPLEPDCDADGLGDAYEVLILGTSALNADSDDDGAPDIDEVYANSDATRAESTPEVLGDGVDNDLDGLVDEDFDFDRDEVENSADNCPRTANPNQADLDGDGEGELCDVDDGRLYLTVVRPEHVEAQHDARAVSYNLYRGSLDVLRDTGIYSQEPGTNPYAEWFCARAEPAFDDGLWPLSADAFFWLITANDSEGFEFAPGLRSDGTERPIWDGGSCGLDPRGGSTTDEPGMPVNLLGETKFDGQLW